MPHTVNCDIQSWPGMFCAKMCCVYIRTSQKTNKVPRISVLSKFLSFSFFLCLEKRGKKLSRWVYIDYLHLRSLTRESTWIKWLSLSVSLSAPYVEQIFVLPSSSNVITKADQLLEHARTDWCFVVILSSLNWSHKIETKEGTKHHFWEVLKYIRQIAAQWQCPY